MESNILLLLLFVFFVYYYFSTKSLDKFSIIGNKQGLTLDQREQSREKINKDEYDYVVNHINISPLDN
jgi:cell division septal protein FtsQ